MNSELTESSLLILNIVSAKQTRNAQLMNAATGFGILPQGNGIGNHQLVQGGIRDPLHRVARQHGVRAIRHARVPPHALSRHRAASHNVFAVSTMSSMMTHVRPSTSPMIFMTLATLALGRRLSMMARSHSRRFAICLRPHHPAHVRRNHHQILVIAFP